MIPPTLIAWAQVSGIVCVGLRGLEPLTSSLSEAGMAPERRRDRPFHACIDPRTAPRFNLGGRRGGADLRATDGLAG